MSSIIELDVSRHDAPDELARRLSAVAPNEPAEIRLGNVGVCPNRIVPLVGIADCFAGRGHDIRFVTPPHSPGERAVEGFNRRSMSPQGEVSEPFGRVWRFENAKEQYALVDAMVLELDKSAKLANGVRQCLDWCLNEVTDNVLNHSCPSGSANGYLMSQFLQEENRLKICVFDLGIGIRRSFAGSKYETLDAAEAIRLAVSKGVTNGKGQGNGLWGLHEMVKLGKFGKLHIRSDGAEYLFSPSAGIESARCAKTLSGFDGTTLVDFQVVCSESARLQDIFGADYHPLDAWRESREDASGALCIGVAELADGFGSRESASRVRHVVENAIDNDQAFVRLDFKGVTSCSSSFIDELLAKLVLKYGVMTHSNVLRVEGLSGLPAALANIAVEQRLAMSRSCEGVGVGVG